MKDRRDYILQKKKYAELTKELENMATSSQNSLQGLYTQLYQYSPFLTFSGTNQGGKPMANKFKKGDVVEMIADFNGAVVGSRARVIEFQIYDGYIMDYSEFQQGWSNRSSPVPTEYLKLWVSNEKPRAKISFDSVVIEEHKREQILEALEQINQQELIFDKWGFSDTIEKGRGVSLLFYGPPGTGKTLMAQAIADKLEYKLKIISTADIESSSPGQAERNIRKAFEEASAEGADKSILLFDECDSLIYSRSSVGAILGAQINELLSSLERFQGLTIFTTNRLGTLDEAVNRRLALKLEFSMPSREERVEIWKRMFPKKAPLDKQIDWYKLAVVEISGGYIKNAVLRAARMAACEDKKNKEKKIMMAHLQKATKLETESMMEFEKATDEHKHRHPIEVGISRERGRNVVMGAGNEF